MCLLVVCMSSLKKYLLGLLPIIFFIGLVFFFSYVYELLMGLSGSSVGKEPACNEGDLGSIPGLGRSPGGEHGNPFQYSCLEKPRGQRSLVGYSPRCLKESDTNEQHSTQHELLILF